MELLEEFVVVEIRTQKQVNALTYKIIGCCIEVHREMGPGLLESVYEDCLEMELKSKGFKVRRQVIVPVYYKGKKLNRVFKLDLLVVDTVVIEVKAKEMFHPKDTAQILNYMGLLKKPKGILVNFNCTNIIENGSRQYVNKYYADLEEG